MYMYISAFIPLTYRVHKEGMQVHQTSKPGFTGTSGSPDMGARNQNCTTNSSSATESTLQLPKMSL